MKPTSFKSRLPQIGSTFFFVLLIGAGIICGTLNAFADTCDAPWMRL